MIQRYASLLGLGMAVSMVMLGGTALAAPPTGPAAELFTVTGLSINSVQTAGPNTTVDVAITVYDTGNQTGTWEFPYPSITGGNPNALPTIQITNNAITPVTVTATTSSLVSSPDPKITPKQSATAIYAFTVKTSQLEPLGDQYSIQLVPHSSGVFHMYQATSASKYNTAPVDDLTPPISVVGQLPEVPLAAGLPLVALGTVGALWMLRRNAHHRSAAQ